MVKTLESLRFRIAVVTLVAALTGVGLTQSAKAQDGDDMEKCIILAASLFNTYSECVSQVVSYHAAKVTDPDVTIYFAKSSCGIERQSYVRVLSKCMGRDVANAMADSEEAGTLVPHLLQLIANARKQKVHGDLSPPAQDDPYHARMTFKVLTNASGDQPAKILATGRITKDAVADFKSFLVANQLEGSNAIIALNSPGGRLKPSLALGREIRQHEFSIKVGSDGQDRPQCNSACVYVFLGGQYRTASVGQLGVHRFYQKLALNDPNRKAYDSIDLAAVQKLTAQLVEYVVRMGASSTLVARAADTPADTISYLTKQELNDFRVVRQKTE